MNMMTSASCSIAPDSRRSLIIGRLSVRDSTLRLSCESAITGHFSSLASDFRPREISPMHGRPVLVAGAVAAAHQLQVVDDDQAELAALARLAAGAGAHLGGAERAALVDVEAHLAELLDRLREAPPLVVAQVAGAQVALVDAAERADHPQGELRGAHFHREHDDRQAFLDGHVLGDVERERGLAHRRPRRQHDQVARLQARR